jgi:hypothetical protein
MSCNVAVEKASEVPPFPKTPMILQCAISPPRLRNVPRRSSENACSAVCDDFATGRYIGRQFFGLDGWHESRYCRRIVHPARFETFRRVLPLSVMLAAFPRLGWGQQAATPRDESKVQLRVTVPDGAPFISVLDQCEQVVARCARSCDLWLVRGNYTVEVSDGRDTLSSHDLELRHPTTLTVTPAKKGVAYLGMTMGFVGPVVSIAGLVWLVIVNAEAQQCANENGGPVKVRGDEFVGSLLLFAGGAGMTAGGWILYARNRRPGFDEKSRASAPLSSTLRVGAVPLVGGVAVSATLTF